MEALMIERKKRCARCKLVMEIKSNFYVTSKGKPNAYCIPCHSIRRKTTCRKEFGNKWKQSLIEKGEKWCSRCQSIKIIEDFSKGNSHGRSQICKECTSLYNKSRLMGERGQEIKERRKANYIKSKEIGKTKDWQKNRWENIKADSFSRYKLAIRSNLRSGFRRYGKNLKARSIRTNDLLGASYLEVKEFIERQFISGMSWDNYGTVWTFDHIIPLNAANKDIQVLKRLAYYKNLSPMFKSENISKGCKVPDICALWSNPIVPYKESEECVKK